MDGDGHSSKPMRPISRSQPTTKKTASTATYRPSLPTGYTSKAIRSSNRNENSDTLVRDWYSNNSVLIVGGYVFVRAGGVPIATTSHPLPLEERVARTAILASTGNAAEQKNPPAP